MVSLLLLGCVTKPAGFDTVDSAREPVETGSVVDSGDSGELDDSGAGETVRLNAADADGVLLGTGGPRSGFGWHLSMHDGLVMPDTVLGGGVEEGWTGEVSFDSVRTGSPSAYPAWVGDWDGDGLADAIVTVEGDNADHSLQHRTAYVVEGPLDRFPDRYELSEADAAAEVVGMDIGNATLASAGFVTLADGSSRATVILPFTGADLQLVGLAPGSGEPEVLVDGLTLRGWWEQVSPGDLDGDGVGDVLLVGRDAGTVYRFGGLRVGETRSVVDADAAYAIDGATWGGQADFDGDGDEDLAVWSDDVGALWLLAGDAASGSATDVAFASFESSSEDGSEGNRSFASATVGGRAYMVAAKRAPDAVGHWLPLPVFYGPFSGGYSWDDPPMTISPLIDGDYSFGEGLAIGESGDIYVGDLQDGDGYEGVVYRFANPFP